MEVPRFIVLLAAYNGIKYIGEQIESILLQEKVSVNIFVSVDKSTDGTEGRLAEWARSESRLKLLPFNQHFGGAGPNFFRLLREVTVDEAEYVSLADQDDVWHPEKLWRAHCLLKLERASGYSSNVTAFWPTGRTKLVSKAQPQRPFDFVFEAAGPGCTYVLGANLAISLQQLVRRADQKLLHVGYHDWFIYAFARAKGFPWVIDDWSSMQYRQHPNNQIGVNDGWRSHWLRVRKMLSGHGFEQARLIVNLVDATTTPAVQQGLRQGALGYLWLAAHAKQCRRKSIDQFWFFVLCILFAIARPLNRQNV